MGTATGTARTLFAVRKSDRAYDLICLSHLRWDFVYQRPQHLMSRFAAERRVLFVEEPMPTTAPKAYLHTSRRGCGVEVVVPHIPDGMDHEIILRKLIGGLVEQRRSYSLWYYTPMPIAWTRHLKPLAVVYDCMDELSAFKNAPAALKEREGELLKRADLVFTGGHTLFEAKRNQHANVYPFPSSIDVTHFAQARGTCSEPQDQQNIPHVRIGYCGVIDERMDFDLVTKVADARPDWHIVMLGPVVKVNPADLPQRPNIHYLGMKPYKELPQYIAGWDVAILPFARNESTRYISPTKTPEYLAAGRPVVSTSIQDVIHPYGKNGIVHIADQPGEFIEAVEIALSEDATQRLQKVDVLLSKNSWCRTWGRMAELVNDVVHRRSRSFSAPLAMYQQTQHGAPQAGVAS